MAMAFTLAIDTAGAAFDDFGRGEVARIVRDAAETIERVGGDEGICRDAHGKIVGRWRLVGIGQLGS